MKGPVGARVLRSGRRLWDDEDEGKLKKHKSGDNLLHIKANGGLKAKGARSNGLYPVANGGLKTTRHSAKEPSLKQPRKLETVDVDYGTTRKEGMFGKVYSRKRKRTGTDMDVLSRTLDDRKYGKRFFRRLRSKTKKKSRHFDQNVLYIVVGEGGGLLVSSFLSLFLECMRWTDVKLTDLAAFLTSDPINRVYSSHGIDFSLVRILIHITFVRRRFC